MKRFRHRLARWLVGPFVLDIPEREGVWIVSRMASGYVVSIYEADKFRLKMTNNLSRKWYGDPDSIDRMYGLSRRTGRFVGTVKA